MPRSSQAIATLPSAVQVALIRTDQGHYRLSPAFDVLPAAQGLGYQQMRVGINGHDSSIENALSEVAAFGLKLSEAKETVGDIKKIVKTWPQHFAKCGVKARELEMLQETFRENP